MENTELTMVEAEMAASVLGKVLDAMEWAEDMDAYTEGGRITLALTKEQIVHVARAAIKLLKQA